MKMRLFISFKKIFFLSAACIFFVTNSLAAEAPVFDADHYSPQMDDQTGDVKPTDSEKNLSANDQSTNHNDASSSTQDEEEIYDNTDQSTTETPTVPATSVSLETKNKLEALQSEVQSLRGQLEELSHHLQQLETQQHSQYVDLDKRITALQMTQQASTVESVPKKNASTHFLNENKKAVAKSDHSIGGSQPNVAEEQQTYQVAYDLIKRSKYDEAIAALQKMLDKYPSGQFAANAHYWLGELYGLQGKNDQSAAEFTVILKQYPNSPKVSDAQFKIGLIYMAEQKWSIARSIFNQIIEHYPGSASSRLAAEQLKQIKLAGH